MNTPTDEQEDQSMDDNYSDHQNDENMGERSETRSTAKPSTYAQMASTPPRLRKGQNTSEYEYRGRSLIGAGTQKKSNVCDCTDQLYQRTALSTLIIDGNESASQNTDNIPAKGLGGNEET